MGARLRGDARGVSPPKPAVVRFYFDADLLGLGKLLSPQRADFTYPGDPGGLIRKRLRPPCQVADPATKDLDWIPVAARAGWVIVTRDRRIQDRPAELAAVRDFGAKMVNLASADAGTTWAQLEVFMSQWRRIEDLADRPGPFIYSVGRTSFRELPL